MQPYFTLILPCYKVEKYVERCVRSILEQDFEDYEIILVDDGSPDKTPAICDRLAQENARISVIHKENGGLFSARNAGMRQARGRYIWFVDSDDWIAAGALRKLYQACQAGGPDLVKFGHYRVTNMTCEVPHNVQPGYYGGQAQCEVLLKKAFTTAGRYCLSACTHVYCVDFLSACNAAFVSEREIGSEDYLFNLQLLMQVKNIRVLAEPLYYYEQRNGSLTQTYKPDLAQRYIALRSYLLSYCETANMQKWKPMAERFFLWHLIVGTCFVHEYQTNTAAHTIEDARQNVNRIMNTRQVQQAIRRSDTTGMRWQKRVQLLVLRFRGEWLFVRLYSGRVGNNKKKDGKG